MLDVARLYLSASPEDRSGEDRSLVVVHVNADLLRNPALSGDSEPKGQSEGVPAGTPDDHSGFATEDPMSMQISGEIAPTEAPRDRSGSPEASEPSPVPDHVPDGTSDKTEPICQIDGLGGIEPETARKLSCDADLLGAIVDAAGEVLALGRTRRLVSRAQRRALMIRDHGICQFAGCHQTHHLQAHHVVHWVDGGRTDLDNLILLCRRHHTVVHEGGMVIRRASNVSSVSASCTRRWEFLMPDGSPHREWYTADGLLDFLARHADKEQAEQQRIRRTSMIDNVVSFRHQHAQRIQPRWRGERFSLHECVQALFGMQAPSRSEPTESDGNLTAPQAA